MVGSAGSQPAARRSHTGLGLPALIKPACVRPASGLVSPATYIYPTYIGDLYLNKVAADLDSRSGLPGVLTASWLDSEGAG